MAAALNWVLKDGLGQLGGMAFTAFALPCTLNHRLVNSRLDADSRGWRILSAWLLEISTWLEVLTPLCPHYFLLFATLANIGKNISWLAGSATRAGIRYGFVNAHNMGDLTAKEGSQTVAITVFGTFLGIMLSNLIGPGHMQYVLLSSLCISSVSLFSIYRSLHCVSLPTLNYQVNQGCENECVERRDRHSPLLEDGSGSRADGRGGHGAILFAVPEGEGRGQRAVDSRGDGGFAIDHIGSDSQPRRGGCDSGAVQE